MQGYFQNEWQGSWCQSSNGKRLICSPSEVHRFFRWKQGLLLRRVQPLTLEQLCPKYQSISYNGKRSQIPNHLSRPRRTPGRVSTHPLRLSYLSS